MTPLVKFIQQVFIDILGHNIVEKGLNNKKTIYNETKTFKKSILFRGITDLIRTRYILRAVRISMIIILYIFIFEDQFYIIPKLRFSSTWEKNRLCVTSSNQFLYIYYDFFHWGNDVIFGKSGNHLNGFNNLGLYAIDNLWLVPVQVTRKFLTKSTCRVTN